MIAILTACYGRPEVFKLFLRSLPKDAYVICVGEEGVNKDSFYEYTVQNGIQGTYAVYQNRPLGKKWNHGLQLAKQIPFEYLVVTGSDDIFCPSLWDFYKTLNVHYAGILDIYFYDHPTGKIKYHGGFINNRRGEPHGAGRALHRTVLDTINWKLWEDEINIGLDASMTKSLNRVVLSKEFIKLKSKGFAAVDIKTTENLHTIKEYSGKWVDDDEKIWLLNKIGWTTA